MPQIVLAGGSGLLGQALTAHLVSRGQAVVVLSRNPSASSPVPGVRGVAWNPDGSAGEWARELSAAEAVVNLSGASLADERWTSARKQVLRSSRVLSTRSLVTAIRDLPDRPKVFVQASGAGYYGATLDDREMDESFPPGDDYLGQLCVAWEAEARPVETLGCRLVLVRSGVALTMAGGALARMATPFRLLAGGPIASGRQYMSWIHLEDWVNLIAWAIDHADVRGPINATAPQPVTNTEFSRAFGRALRRPSWIPVPAAAVKLLYGELADALLVKGQRVVPRRALELGFTFRHPTVGPALADVVSGHRT